MFTNMQHALRVYCAVRNGIEVGSDADGGAIVQETVASAALTGCDAPEAWWHLSRSPASLLEIAKFLINWGLRLMDGKAPEIVYEERNYPRCWVSEDGNLQLILPGERREDTPLVGAGKFILQMDGNAWMAHRPDFVDLARSTAGYGTTPEEAIRCLIADEQAAPNFQSSPIEIKLDDSVDIDFSQVEVKVAAEASMAAALKREEVQHIAGCQCKGCLDKEPF